ncbi:hypothetical protein ABH935_008299 [Catenulispora sp. GAS73]|uniref:hypothetical protein n=1 Tax=Catenulispora sp. GAS73 TaxID=3156269 RepID=UPI003514A88E
MRRIGWAAMSAAVLLAAVAGCSSSGVVGQESSGGGALTDELKQFHDTAVTGGWVDFGQPAPITALMSGAPGAAHALQDIRVRGSSVLAAAGPAPLAALVGFDPFGVNRAVDVGRPPHTVGVLDGTFDPAAIGAKLAAAGLSGKDLGGGQTEWDVPAGSAFAQQLSKEGVDGALSVLRVSATRIVYGWDDADLQAALPVRSVSLAADPLVSGLADCLGDATAAEIFTGAGSVATNGFAVGVRIASATDITEVLCVAARDDATAQTYATTMTSTIATGIRPLSNHEPWSKALTAPAATVVGGANHLVRLTAKASDPAHADVLFQAADIGAVGVLIGTQAPS